MKEITRIITARITFIGDADEFLSKEDHADDIKEVMEIGLCADNVVIDNVQDFIMEKDDRKSGWKDAIMRRFAKRD